MFHNYFFIKRLVKEISPALCEMELLECFTQNKDELILGFASTDKSLYIRANLDPSISLLNITNDFKRAKKNSVTLFKGLIGKKVKAVSEFRFERSFQIEFESAYSLIFKLHGSRSNILLINPQMVVTPFRSALVNDLNIQIEALSQTFELSQSRFESCDYNVQKFLPALGKEVREYLNQIGFSKLNDIDKWRILEGVINQLESEPIKIIHQEDSPPNLTLLPSDHTTVLSTSDAIEATNKYYELFTRDFYLNRTRRAAIKPLKAEIKKTENYLANTKQKLESVQNRRGYDEVANIIMANLHQINKGSSTVALEDFYNNSTIEIKLNPEHSPQKNAENLYRKSKNQKVEIDKLKENIEVRELTLHSLKVKQEELIDAEDIKSLRVLDTNKKQPKESIILPYHQFEFRGFQILVGKNAKSNDQLTLKIANKNDLWLHAKDVAGSHVVIKHQAGKGFPKDVIERAAQAAAWYSKRKTDSMCPVIFTPKKFVRKRKGDPAGTVMVDREEVVMVVPENI